MRLLIVTSDYPPATGGMAEYSDAWAKGLREEGFEVKVLAWRRGAVKEGRPPAIPAEYVDFPSFAPLTPFFAGRALSSALAVFEPDIILAHTWIGWAPALAFLKSLRRRKIHLYAVAAHGAEILGSRRSFYYRFLMNMGLRAADIILPVSRFTSELIRECGVSAERIRVVGNGVDIERFRPAPRREDLVKRYGLEGARVLLTVGGLVDRKGHDLVIEAMAILREICPDLKYVIAGGWALSSSRETFLRDLVRRRRLEDRVIFTGYIEDALLPDIYRLGDIFVMPGREVKKKGWVEGFGISFLEAAASGLPIVATLSGGSRDALSDENAVIVPEENPPAIAEAVRRILYDANLLDTMSRAGVEWARRNSWSRRIAEGARYLKEIVK